MSDLDVLATDAIGECDLDPPVCHAHRAVLRNGDCSIRPAHYRGLCLACESTINVGDPITRDDDGEWVHDTCPTLLPERPRPICDRCWLEQPCGCEEA